MKKHSVTIRGHRTSFSIEDDFLSELKAIAKAHNLSLAQLLTKIDADRFEEQNLSSAVRLYILRNLQDRLAIQ